MPRSDPLIIDKETGEPKNLPWTYQKYEPWKVVILDLETRQRKSRKFFSYVEAKQVRDALKEKYGDTHQIGIVSRQMGYGPPYSKVPDRKLLEFNDAGLWWCPYCRNFREYIYSAILEMRRCEFCMTTEVDFHVIKCNPILWSPVTFKRVFGEVRS